MRKLSTGQDSTLGTYRDNCVAFFGEDSAATKLIDSKISDSPKGRDEEVIADEEQMLYILYTAHVS